MRRFVEHSVSYCKAVAKEAELRERGCTLDIESYTKLRREFCSVQFCADLFEYGHGLDLPNAVYDNNVFRQMYWAGVDMIYLSNVS